MFNRPLTLGTLILLASSTVSLAAQPMCCAGDRGGVSYCDSSAGRYVCKSGEYSSCYCTRHAIMDLQKLAGCCLWHGGVMRAEVNLVVCNDGTFSEECSLVH